MKNIKLTHKQFKQTRIGLIVIALMLSTNLMAQTNFYPSTGPVAFGIMPVPTGWNLQLHGVNDYCIDTPDSDFFTELCYGKTSRLGFTNTITGSSLYDGMQLRMSKFDFTMENLEKKGIYLRTNNLSLNLSGATNRMWMGGVPSTASKYGIFNIQTMDNGFYIRIQTADRYGISIQPFQDKDIAYQVVKPGGTDLNFVVKGNGEVFARKYTTTLNPIPDYVFAPSYNLMPLGELRTYITTNQHLPNIPSAEEYEETGVDLGEMNRLLLEKTEELTLYILQLEERIKAIEDENADEE